MGVFLALLLLVSSLPQISEINGAKAQWLGSNSLSSIQDMLYEHPVAYVEAREDGQESAGHYVAADKAALKHPAPVFYKLARLWLDLSHDGKPFNVKPLSRGPPFPLKA